MKLQKKYILATSKSYYKNLSDNENCIYTITQKNDLNIDLIDKLKPNYIFFPHWSYIIPKKIYENYTCVVFHMTDLPYGRGGSPLQNLIVRGIETTKISALKCTAGIDTGDIYLKRDLSLNGSAEQIFLCASKIIEEIIQEILEKDMQPQPQQGEIVAFTRRTPEQSDLNTLDTLKDIYDYIRMLDAEGYPHAFICNEGNIKFEFTNANFDDDKQITASVRIINA